MPRSLQKKQNDSLRYAVNLIAAAAAVYLAAGAALQLFAQQFVKVFHKSATLQNPVAVPEWAMAAVNLILAFFSLWAALRFLLRAVPQKMRPSLRLVLPKDRRLWLFLPVFLGVGVGVNIITSMLQKWLVQSTHYTTVSPPIMPQSGFATFIYFFAMCVIPAVLEELLCRGAMQGMLSRWGVWFSIVVSSTVFTLLHGDIAQMPGVFVLSILLGLSAYATGSLLPGIVLHFANNTVAFFFLLVGQKASGTVALGVSVYMMLVLCIAAAVCTGLIVSNRLMHTLHPVPKFYDARNRQSRTYRLATAPMFMGVMLFLAVRAVLPFFWGRA